MMTARHDHPAVDPDRRAAKNAFDHAGGVSGQTYSREREEALRLADPSGAVDADPSHAGEGAGARASVDPASGEVHGSGGDVAEDPVTKPGASRPGAGKNQASR
ncbi:hypothetical protein [Sphingomonas radiodurans]|uniref:hypothetical protein n=1 Tax=Sphingomonas radiodurans TaxID=2890321 RepID=UPI001E5A58D1|nr:hypothetical protein [Sphingomonas radiodurans]WBH18140.1 hypothetical protein LLW23_08630 [Sphingomonas radiodurans]